VIKAQRNSIADLTNQFSLVVVPVISSDRVLNDCMETLVQKLRARTSLLSIAEVSDLLGFHPVTLRDWARDGRLPGVRIGSAWRFDPLEIARWLEARRTG
jgi:excisionase family DNA binding protein